MSVKAMAAVWEHSRSKGGERLLLLAIADYAKDDGSGAWPSLTRLCQKTLFSERNVRYLLRRLEESGELSIRPGGGPHGCNLYALHLPDWQPAKDADEGAKIAPAKIAPRQNRVSGGGQNLPGGGKDFTKGGQPIAPEPLLNRHLEPSEDNHQGGARARATQLPEDFPLTDSMRAWASEKVPALNVEHAHEKFCAYWWGSGGTKLRWEQAWRTWMLGEVDRLPRGGRGSPNGRETLDQRNERVLKEVFGDGPADVPEAVETTFRRHQ